MMRAKEFSSKRIVFRFPKPEDAKAFYQNFDVEVARNISGAPWPFTLEHATAFVMDSEHDRKKDICYEYILADKKTDEFIGIASLNLTIAGEPPGQVGYWIAQKYRGQGYAFEALREMIQFAKALQLVKVWASARHDNVPSINLMKKVGMKFKGERTGVYEGKEMTEVIYEIIIAG